MQVMRNNGGSHAHGMPFFTPKKQRIPKGIRYRLATLIAPIFLIPVFLFGMLAFCLIVAPLLYLLMSIAIILSGWTTESESWIDEE